MQELQTRSTRNGMYFIRDPRTDQRLPIADFIATCEKIFSADISWREIFSIVTQYITERDQSYDSKRGDAMKEFIDNLPNTILPAPRCYGCTEFYHVNQNIYHPEVCRQTLVLAGQLSQLPNNLTTIKDEVCALLNGNGGNILFDTVKTYYNVIPRGTYIT